MFHGEVSNNNQPNVSTGFLTAGTWKSDVKEVAKSLDHALGQL